MTIQCDSSGIIHNTHAHCKKKAKIQSSKNNVLNILLITVGVGLHQGSSLSPYLFAMIMDVLAHGIKDLSPWCTLYADDIVLCGTRREVVEKKLEEWRRAMEDRGLKINRKKTVYLRFNVDGNLDGNSDINLHGQNLERVNTFNYLGAHWQKMETWMRR